MVAAFARLGQTAIALELGKCGRLNTLPGALVTIPFECPHAGGKKPPGSAAPKRPQALEGAFPKEDLRPLRRDC
jgi:hypothetical protein